MEAVEILNNHHLKRSSCREGIINVVMSASQALSENEIRERLTVHYDRTTFYRSFKALEEHKIIHKIVVDKHVVKYALDPSINHGEEHVHFYCSKCNTVKCLKDLPSYKYQLPEGYSDYETEVIIKGICSTCKKQFSIE